MSAWRSWSNVELGWILWRRYQGQRRSEETSCRRSARIGGQQWRALASACGAQCLEYGIAHVDEVGTRGRLPRWWHGRSAQRLADDAAVAQGAEVTVERDGD
jgi:hypothetical protein